MTKVEQELRAVAEVITEPICPVRGGTGFAPTGLVRGSYLPTDQGPHDRGNLVRDIAA